ncbi:hypothetical protein K1T71_001261 [Dendrolimus kikuchii]|uniref:Uncharacterized protein n=1 Tax=Dendrolimus kikuchii TaxID=765133 RepID=A0ACC1DH99_9NEOP|nr:hypothetical protein K1T71_001261 [Dendrolimus kikuchii]
MSVKCTHTPNAHSPEGPMACGRVDRIRVVTYNLQSTVQCELGLSSFKKTISHSTKSIPIKSSRSVQVTRLPWHS